MSEMCPSVASSKIISGAVTAHLGFFGARTFLSNGTRISANAFRIFPARPLPYGTTERPVVRQSQRDCVLQPRVAESARLPWVSVRAIFNPTGAVSPLRHRAPTPLGLADTTRFSQGSSRLATLGFGAESLWDSLIIPKGIGSIPSGIGPPVCQLAGPLARRLDANRNTESETP